MAPSHPLPNYPTQTPPSLLLLILDLHPLSWSLLAQPPAPAPATLPVDVTGESPLLTKMPVTGVTLGEMATILMVFLNAHLASRWGNSVVVYGAGAGSSRLLYPPPNDRAGPSKPNSNTYRPFQMLDQRFEASLREMIQDEESRVEDVAGKGLNEPPAIVSALTKALCYINRVAPPPNPTSAATSSTMPLELPQSQRPDSLETRILVVNATPGGPAPDLAAAQNGNGAKEAKVGGGGGMRGGYVGLMNCVFAAQKAKVPIDVLSLPPPATGTSPPIFLQQAAHLTEGIYWRWNGKGALLQYLHSIYLPPPCLRHTPFALPPQDAVDFRAVCFCHHDVVDVGFVCSVCLSIFCKPVPTCGMCKTRFPIKALPMLKELAGHIAKIPIPETIPPPPTTKKEKRDGADGAAADGVGKGKKRRGSRAGRGGEGEPIEVD